ncbi:hypothetical protein [Shinella sp.]|uniref:hypothetical protein n=1 Tax=Shinella sp. TaxID=1870904 RepID=UPI002582F2CA|nr:hypothetical protein [Shinella sp.]MCW5708972.1 hypothetical protein [Shinella sp.]
MSHGNTTDAERIASAFTWPMVPVGADPLFRMPFEIGIAMYRQWLGASSRLLQDQSAYLQNLAECADPLNMLVCQTEFAEKSVVAGLDELRRGVDAITDTACEQLTVDRALPQ